MSHYSFPILSDQDLLPCLKDMEVQLTAAQMAKPTYEVVKPVYENFVYCLMGITREELQQPVFAAIDVLEFPELHDESIPFLAFMKCLTRLVTAAGIRDFSLQDIHKPDSLRLRRTLSALINFARFREEKLQPYAEMQEQISDLLEETQRLEGTKQELAGELERLLAEREAEEPDVAALEATTQDLYLENQQLNKQQISLNTEARALKNQTNTYAAQGADLNFKLQTAKQKAANLRGQIVESPEKLEARLKELHSAVDRERSLIAKAERQSRELQGKLDVISKVKKDVQKALGTMEVLGVELSKKKEASHKVKALKAEVHSHEAEAAQLKAEHQHLQRQMASLSDRLQRLEHQSKVRKEAALSAVDEQRRNKEATEAENALKVANMAQHEAAMRSLRERIKELQTSHAAQISMVVEKYQLLKQQIEDYHRKLEAVMVTEPETTVRAISLR